MASLRPPSTSPSPSPAPGTGNPKSNARASMGPSSRPAPISAINPPLSPRPGAGRPTSELLGSAGMFQTPEAEAIDLWFENLQNYEATLEEMAAASLDANFKEELSAIEQWFRVLSEAERTAALYSLLQHSTQVQIRFFITVLQQMARSDPMTALLSPSAGGSMQSQMEAKLAQMGLKSPGIKPPIPASPAARNFGSNLAPSRQSLAMDSSFLSPDSANISNNSDAAATLAQQRAKLKANAAHRISAPVLASPAADGTGNRNVWSATASQLSQVAERGSDSSTQELSIQSPNAVSRPKSMDFSGLANSLRSPRLQADVEEQSSLAQQLSPMIGGNWASMVNTPMVPLFEPSQAGVNGQNLDAAATKLANWQGGTDGTGGRFSLDDARKYRRPSKVGGDRQAQSNLANNNAVYNDDGNLISTQPQRNGAGALNGAVNGFLGGQGWSGVSGTRSPALSNVSSGRFGSEDGSLNGINPAAFNVGMSSPGLGMGMAGLAGMGQLNPFTLNALSMSAMGLSPEAQLLAAQMAAANGFVQPGLGAFGINMQPQNNNNRNARGSSRSSGGSKSNNGRDSANKEKEEEVDPNILSDVPAWLRSLRLHKYTPNFENMNWKDMVTMDEAALEAKGVAALGARRKMLKTFEAVRAKMGIEMPSI